MIGIDYSGEPDMCTLSRPGTKLIYKLRPGEDWKLIEVDGESHIVICHPEQPPKMLLEVDGVWQERPLSAG